MIKSVLPKDLTGCKFGKLTVEGQGPDYITSTGKHQQVYQCRCECGNIKQIRRSNLISGTISCGCHRSSVSVDNGRKCIIDLTGMNFGYLHVIGDSGKRANNGSVKWDCVCVCGRHCFSQKRALVDRKQQSCGCMREGKIKDLSGHRYSRLLVLNRVVNGSLKRGTYWNCICDCGNYTAVERGNLVHGITTSCGCYAKQRVSEIKLIDLTGQTYGLLTVVSRIDNGYKDSYWLCQCACGKQTVVRGSHLRSSDVVSCGCLTLSKGELFVDDILCRNHIEYKRQIKFDGLTGIGGNKLSYDFGIYRNDVLLFLIEYQGSQHYKPSDYFGGEKQFEIQQFHDALKKEYAEKYLKVPLLEIPYTVKAYEDIFKYIFECVTQFNIILI